MRFVFLLFIFFCEFAYAQADTKVLSTAPKEIYGDQKAEIKIKIGNGGAGPTGIIRALAQDYLNMSGEKFAIAWYQDVSIKSLEQLKSGVINMALVYERSQAQQAQTQGWGTNYAPIFNDHFLIVGPKNNPAAITNSDFVDKAFIKIFRYGDKIQEKVFLSRDDDSGVNVKEKSIWNILGLRPWEGEVRWYLKLHAFPKEALLAADKDSLYTMTDQATWLLSKAELRNLEAFLYDGSALTKPCFALLGKNPSREVLAFLDYLKSSRAQNLIANFGKDVSGGVAFFTAANQMDF